MANGFPSTFRTQPTSGGGGSSGTAAKVQLTVLNDSGGPLTKGTCVWDTGGAGPPVLYPSVIAANGALNTPSLGTGIGANILGMLAEDIADGEAGVCVTFGLVEGFNTTGLGAGNAMSCDTAGQLVYLSGAYLAHQTGYVVTEGVDGSFFVLPARRLVAIHDHNSDDLGGGKLRAGVQVVIDGGGSPITPGDKVDIILPWDLAVDSVTLMADQAGDIEVDLWKDAPTFYPPDVADSICASALPTLTAASFAVDNTLTGWTTALGWRDVIRVHVNSAATLTRVTLALEGLR